MEILSFWLLRPIVVGVVAASRGRAGLLLLMASIATASAATEGIEVKGITLGEPMSALAREYPVPPPCTAIDPKFAVLGDRSCDFRYSTYGGAEVQLSYYVLGETIESAMVRLKPSEFEEVVRAMESRFGAPTSQRKSKAVTRLGVEHENVTINWKRADGEIVATKFSGSLDRSTISFQTRRYVEEVNKRTRETKKERSGDL